MNWKDGWPEDIWRHSYGSYHLAKNRNAALTAEQMGTKVHGCFMRIIMTWYFAKMTWRKAISPN